MTKIKYTKEEQQKAMDTIVKLINKYKLAIVVEHEIKVIPGTRKEEDNAK